MKIKLVTEDIYNDYDLDYFGLDDNINYRCDELLEEYNLPLVTFKLWYDLSYSQSSWVWFIEFNISFDELIKYMIHNEIISEEDYNILYSACEEWLYDIDYKLLEWNKIYVDTYLYDIPSWQNIHKLLTEKYWNKYTNDDWSISWEALKDILNEDKIEEILKELMDSICYDLKEYWYNYIKSEDEHNSKDILFDRFITLNNIETNIEYFEWWSYLKTKQELLELNIPIETYTKINDNNIDDYYIANDIINSIESKERTVQYYSLTI